MGLGPVGTSLARLILERPALRLVGAIDPRPDLAGRDLGTLLGGSRLGVVVGADARAVLAKAAPQVVVHATGSYLADVEPQLRTALRAGAGAVSTCEELSYPFYRHPALARSLDALARRHGVALLGTGVNPGFVMDKLAVTLLGACRAARSVRVHRVVDAAKRREPLQRKIGAGISREAFDERRRAGTIGHVGLPESAHMVADAMGLPSQRVLQVTLEPVLAKTHVVTAFLEVQPGRVAGIAQTAVVVVDGQERVRLELEMYVGAPGTVDAIAIDGRPAIEASIAGGIHGDEGTAAVIVNCAELLPSLAPGLRTMLDVPLRGGGGLL
jgi:4-hydroxy-tetrahydrodipicolinate reductase